MGLLTLAFGARLPRGSLVDLVVALPSTSKIKPL